MSSIRSGVTSCRLKDGLSRAILWLTVATLAGSIACGGKRGPLYDTRSYPDITLAASAAAVVIEDRRPAIDDEAFDFRATSLPGRGQTAAPPLPAQLDSLLAAELTPLLSGEGPILVCRVAVTEARVGWNASLLRKSGFARVELEIAIAAGEPARVTTAVAGEATTAPTAATGEPDDRTTGEILEAGKGESWGRDYGFDPATPGFDGMLKQAFVAAFRDFMTDRNRLRRISEGLDRSAGS